MSQIFCIERVIQERKLVKVLLLVGHVQVYPATPKPANLSEVFWGHMRDTATLKS